jgi:hypothetical protein
MHHYQRNISETTEIKLTLNASNDVLLSIKPAPPRTHRHIVYIECLNELQR